MIDSTVVPHHECWVCLDVTSGAQRGVGVVSRTTREGRIEVCREHYMELVADGIDTEMVRRDIDSYGAMGEFCADVTIILAATLTERAKPRYDLVNPTVIVDILEMLMEDIREKILEQAWEQLPDDQRKALVEDIAKAIARQAGRGTVESHVKELFSQHIDDLIAAELDKRESDVVARVKAELKKRWDELVNAVVTRRLQEAVQKIYTEVVRGK
jgi:hypothetical protein